MSIHKIYAGTVSVIVLMTLVWGFFIVGSPMNQRQRRFDIRRIEDLQNIHQQILDIVYEGKPFYDGTVSRPTKPLPETLDEVAAQATYLRILTTDPQTGEPYEYNVTGDVTYELCATFNDTSDTPYNVFWNHPSGRYCYSFNVTNASEGFENAPTKAIPFERTVQ